METEKILCNVVTELINFYIVLLTVTHRITGTLKLFPSSMLEIAEVDKNR